MTFYSTVLTFKDNFIYAIGVLRTKPGSQRADARGTWNENLVMGHKGEPNTKIDWPTDRRS
jgi:hypothetical protein